MPNQDHYFIVIVSYHSIVRDQIAKKFESYSDAVEYQQRMSLTKDVKIAEILSIEEKNSK